MAHDATTTTQAAGNPFELRGRAAKVSRLVTVIDAALDDMKVTLPEVRCERIASMGEVGWASASAIAKCALPSLQTRWAVVRVYEARVRAAVNAALAQAIAGALKAVG